VPCLPCPPKYLAQGAAKQSNTITGWEAKMIPHPLSMVHIFPEEAVTTAEAVCFLVLFGVSEYARYKE